MGIGNLLLTDDGFGIHVVKRLIELQEKNKFGKNIKLIDGGAAGIDILYYIENQKIVIFIDTIRGGKEPGYIYNILVDDLNIFKDINMTSLHDMELTTVLKIAKETNKLPDTIYLIGVEPKDYNTLSMELTPEIEKTIPKIVKIVENIIQKQS